MDSDNLENVLRELIEFQKEQQETIKTFIDFMKGIGDVVNDLQDEVATLRARCLELEGKAEDLK